MQKIGKTGKTVLVSIIAAVVLLLSAVLPVLLLQGPQKAHPNTDAFTNTDTSSYYSVGELLTNASTAAAYDPFNETNMNKLINVLSGSASGTISSQLTSLTTSAATPITSQSLRAKTYLKSSGQSVVVRIGGLDWIVTYLSKDTDGNLIATLWLSSNYQSAWSGTTKSLGEHFGILNGGLYSDWSDDGTLQDYNTIPGNMYGTSYIRAETLNNPYNRAYISVADEKFISATAQSTTTDSHPFALYTASNLGLTKYLTTPDKMQWMVNRQNPVNRGSNAYWLANESLTSGNTYNYTASWSAPKMNYEEIAGYDNWGKDYLWLPSSAEIGYSDTNDGIWETSTAERSIYSGSGVSLSVTGQGTGTTQEQGNPDYAFLFTCTRSVPTSVSGGSTQQYVLANTSAGTGVDTGYAACSMAVRPCMLFNLTKAFAALGADHPAFTVSVEDNSDSVYLGPGLTSYGSAYPAAKSQVIIQISTLSGDLVIAQKISFLTQANQEVDLGGYLTYNTQYRVRIITPTYLRYSVFHYIDVDDDKYNNLATNSFIINHTGSQGVVVSVDLLQDDSWLTYFS